MDRSNLLDKIRALLGKTVENGCTEHEAMAALDKARAMMDAYEVTGEDLQLSKDEGASIFRSDVRDTHGIRSSLCVRVSQFTDTKVWRERSGTLVFCGLPSDMEFATWLLDTLTAFVQSELARHLMGCVAERGQRRFIINGFVGGCTNRINKRLVELIEQSKVIAGSNSRALVVVKTDLIAAKMKEAGIELGRSRSSSRKINRDSYAAGKAAGDRASFGRPVSGAGATLRLV